jgi:two-component system LytT family response regulator
MSSPMRVIVVDDEAPARRKVLRLLRHEPDISVVAEADGGEAAVAAIAQHRPDIVFLDVQMPGMDGFEVARAVAGAPRSPRLVFITAHDQYALRAFEVHALNYLLKPVSESRFREVVEKARQQLAHSDDALAAQLKSLVDQLAERPARVDRLLVQKSGRAVFVPVTEIDWAEADRNYVVLHCGAEEHVLRTTIESVERMLDPRLFVRINRSSLVRLDAVRELIPWFHGEFKVMLPNEIELRWSRRYVGQRPELLRPLSGTL